MKVYRNFEEIDYKKETVLTVGTFDGVHKGHQLIIDRLNRIANENGWRSVLLTFDPHPQIVLQRENMKPIKLLTTIDERLSLFEKFGLTDVLIIPFSKEFSRTPPKEFVKEYLVEKIGLRKILIGFDHLFGKDRAGNESLLKDMGAEFNFDIEKIDALLKEGEKVSSTKIRNYLELKAISEVNEMLGYNYTVSGIVTKGDGRGRTIGLPTANISYNEYKHLPGNGVYFVKSIINGEKYFGLANIGNRPTFTNSLKTYVEVHYLDFNSDIYNQYLEVEFLYFIRDEIKFESKETFLEQIEKDKQKAKELIKLF
ncbi:bifunctional riboflavin kinase/FAD synthetase [Bacteroidetes/Chlorobi group bacterium ChocPot_Mid]|nr:MAG: bifunctional riboflavin kinase/FAD synthetase [Bacteroidetes/Chlorobi group bacterium ChocPot_Mid]